METKQQLTKKFILGVVIIVVSLILGKLIFIPFILFPLSYDVKWILLIIYILTWPLMFVGIYFAGMEGYRLATHKYKEYKKRTIYRVKTSSKKAAEHTKRVLKYPIKKGIKESKKLSRLTRIPLLK
jgi:predicted DNA repair protein MutK